MRCCGLGVGGGVASVAHDGDEAVDCEDRTDKEGLGEKRKRRWVEEEEEEEEEEEKEEERVTGKGKERKSR